MGYRLSYSAYPDFDDRELNIDIEDEPLEVHTGDEFSFRVEAFDELLNPYDEDTVVNLQLRRVTDHVVISDFNVTDTLVSAGESLIDNARAQVIGWHYLYGQSGSASAISDPILFYGDPVDLVPIPTLSLTADKYLVDPGDTVKLSWSSTNLDSRNLSSNEDDFGYVDISGSMDVVIEKETTFTLRGTGPYGNLSRSVTIQIRESTICKLPVILVFSVVQTQEGDRDKLLITWDVWYVDTVDITGVGGNLAPKGSAEVFLDSSTEFILTAKNSCGSVTESKSITFERDISELSETGESDNRPSLLLSLTPLFVSSVLLVGIAFLPVTGGGVLAYINGAIVKLGILIGIVLRKKKKSWGIVYDESKSEPIPFAIVRVHQGNDVIAQTVSDINGRYGISIEEVGIYELRALANGYEHYVKEVDLNRIGEDVEVVEDIPMVREVKKFNLLKKYVLYRRRELIMGIKFIIVLLMFAGFGYTLYVTLYYPVFLNFLLIFIYLVLFALNILSYLRYVRGAIGHVLEEGTITGIAGVSLRVYENAKQIGVFLTNEKGVVKINLNSGEYPILLHKPGYEAVTSTKATAFEGMKEGFSDLKIEKGGYISKDYYMKKTNKNASSIVITPFGK